MITVTLTADDIARLRFSRSAVWETVACLQSMVQGAASPVHDRGLARCMTPAAAQALDHLGPLLTIRGWYPDTLATAPAAESRDPVQELVALGETDRTVVERDLDVVRRRLGATGWGAMGADQFLTDLTRDLTLFWRHVMDELWERVDTISRADVLERAGELARDGVGSVLNSLHPDVSYDEGRLGVRLGDFRCRIDSSGEGVVLVPSLFRWNRVGLSAEAPGPLVLSYPVNGAGTLWTTPAIERGHVDALIGRTRTSILHATRVPVSTTGLAMQLSLAPATVSAHLTTLSAAGLVHSVRRGRHVLYAQTALGAQVMDRSASRASATESWSDALAE